MKTLRLLFIIAFLTYNLGAKAQDRFEYASVMQIGNGTLQKGTIAISMIGKYEESEIKVSEGSVFRNLTPIIEVVNKMSTEGWEVYNTTYSGSSIQYFLRKKKN